MHGRLNAPPSRYPTAARDACVRACTFCLRCSPPPISPRVLCHLETVRGAPGEAWHLDFAAKAIGFPSCSTASMASSPAPPAPERFRKELDSLADVIAFGVAPALLAWIWGFRLLPLRDPTELPANSLSSASLPAFFSDRRRQSSRTFQHHYQSSAIQSRTPRQEIFCRHADSLRRRRHRRRRAFFRRRTARSPGELASVGS